MSSRFNKLIVPALLTLLCGTLMLQKIDLSIADLGRHLKNGEVFFHGSPEERYAMLHTNLYSFAQKDFPFVNHHWLTGVLFYMIWSLFSFEGLTVAYAVLIAASFLIFYLVAKRASTTLIATGLAFVAMPGTVWRAEERPEGVTFFFMAVFYALLWWWYHGRLRKQWLFSIPVLMMMWVNCHIGFVYGFLVLGMFFLKALLLKDRGKTIFTLILMVSSAIAGCINPAGIRGLLYPLHIYDNYGFTVSENLSVWQRWHTFPQWQITEFFWLTILVGSIIIWRWRAGDEIRSRLPEIILLVSVGIRATLAVRDIPIFCFLMIPVGAEITYEVLQKNRLLIRAQWPKVAAAVLMAVGLAFAWQRYDDRDRVHASGLGLKDGVTNTAEFMQQNGVTGPIFNDYNNGGYLIYYLFHPALPRDQTDHRVFLDNRPEAYPSEFFKLHTQMQSDEGVWESLDRKYRFNAIVFSLQYNNNPETERFLIARVHDPEWAPVFADNFNLVYLRRNDRNAVAIRAHELPRSMFK